MKKRIGVSILGGTGYGAGELLRLFSTHDEVDVVSVVSSSMAGSPITQAHPHLLGFYDTSFEKNLDEQRLLSYEHSVVICALPHGTSAKKIAQSRELIDSGRLKVIDLSGDCRLKDKELHELYYGELSLDEAFREKFVYGLTEIYRKQIAHAQCISNPGCLATASILSVAPIVGEKWRGEIVFDAKTGSSGAGKSPGSAMHHPKRHANFTAYKELEHRHEPEIRQALGDFSGERLKTFFVPHLIPASRGIFVTAYLTLKNEHKCSELLECYREFYKDSPFVRVLDSAPELHNVLGTNFCDISIVSRGRQVVAMAALDNLVKGMAGQAIQNMNIMCSLPETEGLWRPALGIV